jgi:hypothetical protein
VPKARTGVQYDAHCQAALHGGVDLLEKRSTSAAS